MPCYPHHADRTSTTHRPAMIWALVAWAGVQECSTKTVIRPCSVTSSQPHVRAEAERERLWFGAKPSESRCRRVGVVRRRGRVGPGDLSVCDLGAVGRIGGLRERDLVAHVRVDCVQTRNRDRGVGLVIDVERLDCGNRGRATGCGVGPLARTSRERTADCGASNGSRRRS